MSTVLDDNDRGKTTVEGNEVLVTSKVYDAAKFRVGAPVGPSSGGGGAFSWDLMDFQGRTRTEVAVLAGGFNGTQGEIGLSIWDGKEPFGDATQKKVVEFYADHVEFKVPITAPNLGSGTPVGAPALLQSANGRLVLVAQDDGNLVLYADGVPVKALFGLASSQLW